MPFYALVIALFSLIGICGMQFLYLIYFERINRERRKRLAELERKCNYLMEKLKQAEEKLAKQDEIISSIYEEKLEEDTDVFDAVEIIEEEHEEIWADIIEDNSNPKNS